MPTYADFIAQGKTPKQIQDAIAKQYGADSKVTQKFTTGKYQIPVVDGSQGPITQKNVPKNTGIVPPITSAPVTQAPLNGNFGDVASDNVHAPGFEATGVAYQERAQKTADELAKVSTAEGAAKQAAIDKKNEGALGDSKLQETELQRIAKEYGMNVDKSRADAEKIFQRQDQIAGRQANMAAAQAGESGLTMSQGAVQDIKDDVIAKYGSNIANAEQFKAQTNMNLNDALKNTGLQIFDKQANIDLFQKSLTDEAFAPVLNAMTEAAKGNKDAINDVDKYYKNYIQKKADEEYVSMAASESRGRKDKEWQAANPMQKVSIIKAYLPDALHGYMDAALNKIGDYSGMSMDMVLGKIAKVAKDDTRLDSALDLYVQTGGKGNALFDEIIKERGGDVKRAEKLSDLSVDETKNKITTLTKESEEGNPNAYNNPENKAYYKSLTPEQKARFDQSFLGQTKAGTERGKAFEGIKESMGKLNNAQQDLLRKQVSTGQKDKAIADLEKKLKETTSEATKTMAQNSIEFLKSL